MRSILDKLQQLIFCTRKGMASVEIPEPCPYISQNLANRYIARHPNTEMGYHALKIIHPA